MKNKLSAIYNPLYLYVALAMLIISTPHIIAQNNKKPNVIVIYTDDQGAIDLGSYGADDIYSPNIDKLASEGIRFTQAYVAAPVCAPSRAALLTGNYPQRAGIRGNTSARPGSHGLRAKQYTMAELFKDNGYKTGHIGKWHLGMSEESSPNAQGFDYSFGHLRGCIDNYSHYFYWDGPNIHDLYENGKEVFYSGQYFPDLMAEKADQFISKNKDAPFFMFYAINMPHYPYQPTQKWKEYYSKLDFPRSEYAAFISTIDERIGLLLEKLDKLGLRENTIIIYQSDNGYSTEMRAFNGGGNSGPYRGAKNSLFEGGIRLPAIISWKGTLPMNQVNDQMLLNSDWMPTLSSLCELKPNNSVVDGIDQSNMLLDSKVKGGRERIFWKLGSQWAVRDGNWKLIGYPKDTSHKGILDLEQDALFLSDLSKDVSEMENLASKHPQKVAELANMFKEWEFGDLKDIPVKMEDIEHLGLGNEIMSVGALNRKYNNIEVLLDGKRGYLDYSTGQWIGQESKDLEFIIDLKEPRVISTISCAYLNDPDNYIFKPTGLTVSSSNDGEIFNEIEEMDLSTSTFKKNTYKGLIKMDMQANARYLKIKINNISKCPDGHKGVGSPAWLFIDEIIVQ